MENEISQKKKKIKELHEEYINKLNSLKNEQDNIIGDFMKKLEEVKIDEIRNQINKK